MTTIDDIAARQERFYIDHGMIHDRVTGKHVTTDEDTVFCDGRIACCALLNQLNAEARGKLAGLEEAARWLHSAACLTNSKTCRVVLYNAERVMRALAQSPEDGKKS